jgi:Tfp pilus assembly PilM family ATPase
VKKDKTKEIGRSIKKAYDSSKIKNPYVVMAIPEFSVITMFIESRIKEEELKNAVNYEAKQYLPVSVDEFR